MTHIKQYKMINNRLVTDTFMHVLCIFYAFYAGFMHVFYAHFDTFVKVFSITHYEGYENITGIWGI
jgi:hypothetical protein